MNVYDLATQPRNRGAQPHATLLADAVMHATAVMRSTPTNWQLPPDRERAHDTAQNRVP